MRFLVVSPAVDGPRAHVVREGIRSHHHAASVLTLRAEGRLARPVEEQHVLPHGLDFEGLRWEDLVMAFGERDAGWAALPWVLDAIGMDGSPEAPTVVLDDTFAVLGDLSEVASTSGVLAARARHPGTDGDAWGGFAPGLLVAAEAGRWQCWWKDRVLQAVTADSGPSRVPPWWQLPVGSTTIVDPALCLSAHTAGEVELADDGSLLADGRPLALIDFAGLDPARPWWFNPPGASAPSVLLSESPGLKELCAAQADRLREAGWVAEDSHSGNRRLDLVGGIRHDEGIAAWYRQLIGQRLGEGHRHAGGDRDCELPPNPLVAGEVGQFLELLNRPEPGSASGVNPHVDQMLTRRPDLLRAFPHLRWKDRRRFTAWMWSHGLSEAETSLLTLPPPPQPLAAPSMTPPGARRPFGVNLIGYLGAELGLGVAARRMKAALDTAGIPNRTVSYDRTSSNMRSVSDGALDLPYHFNLMLITPDQLPLFVADAGREVLEGHHNIGLWFWESDVPAPAHEEAFGLVDEIWVATNYLRRAFSGHGLPVHVVPSPLVFDVPSLEPGARQRLGLDDRFTFLFSFDWLSEPERKNPSGLADAYRRAFPEPGDTALVIKCINGNLFPERLERLRWELADRDDIIVRDELLSAADRMALVAVADCYVSLHRTEGLGLTMAEAMAVGTPVVATAYSGNLDFMSQRSAMLVPAEEVEVGPGHYYPAHGHWAEPDLDAAAAMMRGVAGDPELRRRLASAAAEELGAFGFEEVGRIASEVLTESWRKQP